MAKLFLPHAGDFLARQDEEIQRLEKWRDLRLRAWGQEPEPRRERGFFLQFAAEFPMAEDRQSDVASGDPFSRDPYRLHEIEHALLLDEPAAESDAKRAGRNSHFIAQPRAFRVCHRVENLCVHT